VLSIKQDIKKGVTGRESEERVLVIWNNELLTESTEYLRMNKETVCFMDFVND